MGRAVLVQELNDIFRVILDDHISWDAQRKVPDAADTLNLHLNQP